MDLNSVLRSAPECASLTPQLLGGHSLGVGQMSDGEGGAVPVCPIEGNPSSLQNGSGRRTSRVWKYFRMVDNCHYVCCLCNFIGAYTNTTNMRKHIQNHHPEIFQDILDHTRPSNRLHFLRSFQPSIFQPSPSSTSQYQQQQFLNSGQNPPSSFHVSSIGNGGSNSHNSSGITPIGHMTQYPDTDQLGGGGEDCEAAAFAVSHCSIFSQRDAQSGNGVEHSKQPSRFKVSKSLYKYESSTDMLNESLEDRKVDLSSLGGCGNFAPGLNENSMGSGEGQGTCDEVSIPLSPEQFLTEDMDQGTSPSTPLQRPESYKLRHNNHLNLVLESLAGDESFMDVTLTAQGKAIKAHKSVLSAVSPYFRRVLKENPCQHPIIIMPRDIRFEELNNIVSYVYKGEMTVAAEELSSLLKTAEVLQVTGLSPSESGSTTSGILSQMQGLPSGAFPNTPNAQSTSGIKKQRQPHFHSRPDSKDHHAGVNAEAQSRIDPLEFLNANMTCVKEEITSENEEGEEMNLQSSKNLPSGSDPAASESSEGVGGCAGSDSSQHQQLHDPHQQQPPHRRKSIEDSQRTQNRDRIQDIVVKSQNSGERIGGAETPPSSPDPSVCPHCLETHRGEALHSHLRLKHPSKSSFVCSCGRVYVRQTQFNEHQKKCKG